MLTYKPVSIDGLKAFIKQHLSSALFRNAYYLMGSQVATSALGFVFWLAAARFYSTEIIGLAGAILTMVSFIAGLADLGLGYGIIRFLPNAGDRANRMMNTGFSIQLLASLVMGIVFLVGIAFWSPAMLVIQSSFIYLIGFILLVLMNTAMSQMRSVFIASSSSRFVMITDVLNRCVAIPSLLMFAFLSGFYSVLGAQSVGLIVTLIFCVAIILPKLKVGFHPRLEIDKGIVKEIMPFSLGNYLGQMVGSIQFWLLPTIVLNLLGAEQTAYFYIGFSLSNAVWMIPASIATSAFSEGSRYEDKLRAHIRNGIKLAIILDVIAVLIVFTLGDRILWLFGKQYAAEGIAIFKIFSLAVFPVTLEVFIVAWARVKKNIKFLITFHAILAVVIIGLIYVMAPLWKLTGIGVAYLVGNTVMAIVAFIWFKIKSNDDKRKSEE